MMHVAAELQLAERLAEGERTVEELAAACGVHADSLQRLLRGLASVGLFRESDPQRFGLTPLAELLRSDHPQSLRQFARMLGDETLHHGPGAVRYRCGPIAGGSSAARSRGRLRCQAPQHPAKIRPNHHNSRIWLPRLP